MATPMISDPSKVLLTTLTPSARQRRLMLAAVAVVLVATAFIIPYGTIQLLEMNGFIPATEAVLVICDLVIAALMASQAMTVGSRGLLLLAGGFLFDALIIIPHALTFPDAFAPSGLLGAGLQTTAWFYIFWHFGLPAAVIGYVCLPRAPRALTASTVYRDTTIVVGLVCMLTWIATAHGGSLPTLFADTRGFTPLANTVTGFDFCVSIVALLALLARRQKSVFDLWLTVAVVALVAELAVTTFVIASRFSLGFYASRILSMAASITVLIALLAETIRQDMRLARAYLALQVERSSKLTTLDAALGAIVHEVKQPISSIAHNAEAAQMILSRPAPDLKELREIAGDILDSILRADEIFTSIRGLFRQSSGDLQQVDMNGVASGVLRGMRADLREHGVIPLLELESELPTVLGHKGQLQEVVFNLLRNALDAMKVDPSAKRTLRVCTGKRGSNAIGISVQDTGPGIAPGQMERIFDPFVTTKKDGMGMGLAICRMIIERHGGQLSASSDIGTGARFEIILPIEPAPESDRESAKEVVVTTDTQRFFRRQRRTKDPLATGNAVV